MKILPVEFTEKTRQLMGEERFERYLKSFEEDVPVSIRLNPRKRGERREERHLLMVNLCLGAAMLIT